MALDPITAVVDPDPYPYYATLRARPALAVDATHGVRLAARSEDIAAVLTSELVAVRPPSQPVPPALAGSAAGALFARLVRQSDGPRHAQLRPAVERALAPLRVERCPVAPPREARDLPRFALEAPSRTLGAALGLDHPTLVEHVDALARAFAPGATPDVAAADAAARVLLEAAAGSADAVGLLVQAHEATAGLIGAALLALARGAAAGAEAAVGHAARHDPPVHNTRRFVIRDGVIAGQSVGAGDTILVVLAAAPELGFGAGGHACPGERLARAMARAAVEATLAAGVDLWPLRDGVSYRPSRNTRVVAALAGR